MTNDPPSGGALALPAPAKINLFLRVRRRRADGYHDLETEFQFLKFADTLHFQTHPKTALSTPNQPRIQRVDRHDFALPADDLTIRAARLLQTAHPQRAQVGVTITLHKVIPPGSGLGGGSSNAATTLLALNHLWRLGLNRAQLAAVGLQLGADVPVFIRGHAAHASGVGERLTPTTPPEQWLCVCLPVCGVSTAGVFSGLPVSGEPQGGGEQGDRPDEKRGNDLEAITARHHPEVADALARLRRFGEAYMSGSGGAVYAGFAQRGQAEHAAAGIPPAYQPFVTQSINRHPLLDFA